MNILLSIKPKYVERIITGQKKYEFRKSFLRESNLIEKIFIYSSSPVKKIVAAFKPAEIYEASPQKLWSLCKLSSGISKSEFDKYFEGKSVGYAIQITELSVLEEQIDPYSRIKRFIAPQNYLYLRNEL